MDIVSHGLWGGAAALLVGRFRAVSRAQVAGAVLLGLAPDVVQALPVAIWSLSQADAIGVFRKFITAVPGAEPTLPSWLRLAANHLHCIMHSVVVAAIATPLALRRSRAWAVPLLGWWLHILLDIPTHSDAYYAFPFLYPVSGFTVNGVAWTTPWVLEVDYAALAAAYAALFLSRKAIPKATLSSDPALAQLEPADSGLGQKLSSVASDRVRTR